MKVTNRILSAAVLGLCGLLWSAALSHADSSFTYQGRLVQNDQAVNEEVDFLFRLFDAETGGTAKGLLNVLDWPVEGGLFTVPLDFGADVFDGTPLWLDIRVNGVQLSPRTKITAAPYAIHALNADGNSGGGVECVLAGAGLSGGGCDSQVTLSIGANAVDSTKLASDAESLAKVSADALRVQLNATSPNLLGGFTGNSVGGNVVGGTIGGGGATGNINQVLSNYGTVSGGHDNTVSGAHGVVGGGRDNSASASYATIGGGLKNTANDWAATVAGGSDNVAGDFCTVGGGSENVASGLGSTIAGGVTNDANGNAATVGGGWGNIATGSEATVPGGLSNEASGNYSFAAGRSGKATHTSSFVWADSSGASNVSSSANHQWTARCAGGVRFFTNASMSSGVQVSAGGNSWSSISDQSLKDNFQPVDVREILDRLAAIPILTWNYKSEDPSIRRMGPMAQDFWPAFGLGDDEMRISTIDADGVAFAAIQGLYEVVQDQYGVIESQQHEINDLHERLTTLEAIVHSSMTAPQGGER
jgi:hypothetical protein